MLSRQRVDPKAFRLPYLARPYSTSDVDALRQWIVVSKLRRWKAWLRSEPELSWFDWQQWETEFWDSTLRQSTELVMEGCLHEVCRHNAATSLVMRLSSQLGYGIEMMNWSEDNKKCSIQARQVTDMLQLWQNGWKPLDKGWCSLLHRMQQFMAYVLLNRSCRMCMAAAKELHRHPQLLISLTDGDMTIPFSRVLLAAMAHIRRHAVILEDFHTFHRISSAELDLCSEAVKIFQKLRGNVEELDKEDICHMFSILQLQA